MVPMTQENGPALPCALPCASRAVFVPAPTQMSVLAVTVATHPDDKLENSPRWCWRSEARLPQRLTNGKPKQNRRGINMRTP